MAEFEERRVADLRVRVDRTLCVGFGDCLELAPTVFRLDDEGIATFAEGVAIDREQLLRACDACPVDALTVWDRTGKQVIP